MFSSIIKLENMLMIIVVVFMLISLLVGWQLKSAFRKYSELRGTGTGNEKRPRLLLAFQGVRYRR